VNAIVVVTTVGTQDQANLIAEELVGRRLTSSVNIIPIQRSVYRWKGKMCDDSEYLLVAKSMAHRYPEIEAAIGELHSYELPEILAFDVSRGEKRFLEWIRNCTQPAVGSSQTEESDL
jgi:periplasmic divalent cation tolerance protein